jgi:hypothetical protein
MVTKWLTAGLLFLGWHFATTFFVPAGAPRARGWIVWPFGQESRPLLAALQGTVAPHSAPAEPAPTVALALAAIASLGFLIALAGLFGILFGILVPLEWWRPAVAVASAASGALFVLCLGPWAVIPLLIDAALLWGVLSRGWSVQGLATMGGIA